MPPTQAERKRCEQFTRLVQSKKTLATIVGQARSHSVRMSTIFSGWTADTKHSYQIFSLLWSLTKPPRTNSLPFPQAQAHCRLHHAQTLVHRPTRLKLLIPYALAMELRCAPVGRDHNRLTVAMANPTDMRAIYHLREATGMTIFPVSCEASALETLLASGW